MSFNKVILQGNLVADPEARVTPNGVNVCSFRIACGRRFAKQGDAVTSDFFTCEAWQKLAEFIGKNFIKGQQIIISGAIQNRNWVDQNGQKRYGDVIVVEEASFCGSKAGGSSSCQGEENDSSERVTPPNFEELSGEDDLPF
jgi:single-strand DNA-binding protein